VSAVRDRNLIYVAAFLRATTTSTLGVTLGAYLAELDIQTTALGLVISAGLMIVTATCYLRFVHGWDALSALLGASPGSMAQVIALSAEFGTNLRGVAIDFVEGPQERGQGGRPGFFVVLIQELFKRCFGIHSALDRNSSVNENA